MHVAFGDHQVADLTTVIMARTFGAPIRKPVLDPGPLGALEPVARAEEAEAAQQRLRNGLVGRRPARTVGTAVEGTPAPPLTNVPPRLGRDPHGAPRGEVSARVQKSEFLKIDGRIVEVCGSKPCYARGWTGAP